jgi:hypothetical protein
MHLARCGAVLAVHGTMAAPPWPYADPVLSIDFP